MEKSKNNSERRGRPPSPAKLRLKKAMNSIDIFSYLSYRDFLQAVYNAIKSSESYSYLQLAEDLGYPRTNSFWMVLTGRRSLKSTSVGRIAKALELKDDHRRYFAMLIDYDNATNSKKREEIFAEIARIKGGSLDSSRQEKLMRYYSQWYHSVIRELIGRSDFQNDPKWVNSVLSVKVKPKEIKDSIDLLIELGFVKVDSRTGKYSQSESQIMPEKKIQKMSVVRYHQQMCDIARDSLLSNRAKRLEYNSLTISMAESNKLEAKKILREACEKLMQLETDAKNNEQIYQFNIHMFPFTRED